MIAFAKIGRGGKVDNRQVHRDAAEHRKRPLSGECAALPGQAPEIAVGVTQVEHAHPHRPFGAERGVIADAVACADFTHLTKLDLRPCELTAVPLHLGHLHAAIDGTARPGEVETISTAQPDCRMSYKGRGRHAWVIT